MKEDSARKADMVINENTGIKAIRNLGYVFILCDDFEKMRAFYLEVFGFHIEEEQPGLMIELRVGSLLLGLRPRGRRYDGPDVPSKSASVQLSFRVPPADVDKAYETIKAMDVEIIEKPANQHWPHRTLYFKDPENNILEIYADIHPDDMIETATGVHALVEN